MAGKGQQVTERYTVELLIALSLKCGDSAWDGSQI